MPDLALHDDIVVIDGMTYVEMQCRWSIAYGWYFWASRLWEDDIYLEDYALALGLLL